MNTPLSMQSFITDEQAALLRGEMLRRAASRYEQIGLYRESAECWSELGEWERAGALYVQGDDPGQAARLWLQAGRYHEALQAYQQWEQRLLKEEDVLALIQQRLGQVTPAWLSVALETVLALVQAKLGQAACHLLNVRRSTTPSGLDFSEAVGRQMYKHARELLARITEVSSLSASCWEALGEYGGWLGRYDLVQEGYEQALAILQSQQDGQAAQERIYRAYLAQARAHSDHLLCRRLKERIVWAGADQTPRPGPFPVERLTLRQTLSGHTSSVWAVALSPDGRTLISSSTDRTIKIWDLSTGKEIRTLSNHTGAAGCIAISPGGQTLVSGSEDGTIKIWDLATGKEMHALTGHTGMVNRVAISPDGRTLISGSEDETIKIWDLSTNDLVSTLTGHGGGVNSVVISPDGQTLVSGSEDGTIKIWDLATGKEIRTLTGHTRAVRRVVISPDGRTLISGSNDETIKVWELTSGEEMFTLTGHMQACYSIAISPDGQTLVSGSFIYDTIKVWDLATGEEIRTLTNHTNGVSSIAISSDGLTLVSGGAGPIKIWRA